MIFTDELGNKNDNIEISIQKKQEKEKFLYQGILRPKPNQRVFELNVKTMLVSECEYFIESDTINYLDVINNTETYTSRKILIKDDFDYVIKLNMKNAISYFRRVWDDLGIDESEDNEANVLKRKQRDIQKFKNK